jgi:hypothetical protein
MQKKEIAVLSRQILDDFRHNDHLDLKVNSCGINEGMEIIMDYLSKNEFGLAFEHLEYVISEMDIKLTSAQIEKMDLIKRKLGKKSE